MAPVLIDPTRCRGLWYTLSKELVSALVEAREGDAVTVTTQLLEAGAPLTIIADDADKAATLLKRRLRHDQATVDDLMQFGATLERIRCRVDQRLSGYSTGPEPLATVVLGTVKGDRHDLGKDLVSFALRANAFAVRDLGTDVPPMDFVEAVLTSRAAVVGLSGSVAAAPALMAETIAVLQAQSPCERRVMVGGTATSEAVCQQVGADAWAHDARAAVQIARGWLPASPLDSPS